LRQKQLLSSAFLVRSLLLAPDMRVHEEEQIQEHLSAASMLCALHCMA
jgi:hypothetical protein